ncbi:MAG: hypothetical protein KC561_20830, partial [Myxococcales bacterium]|nr:hypothetical protein [Myxococcales bacterium]
SVVGRNLARALAAGREVWIRHLLMPGHIDCCTRAVIGAVGKLQGEARFNLMPAFVAFNEGEGKLSNAEIFSAREALASEDIRHKYWDGKAFG